MLFVINNKWKLLSPIDFLVVACIRMYDECVLGDVVCGNLRI